MMTGKQAAETLRRVADVLERVGTLPRLESDPLDPEQQIGAAVLVAFLRDLFTTAGKEQFTRDEILVLLNTLQNDPEIFSVDLVTLFE